ncbi:MAG: hypothetical protein KKA60_09800 [Proteobacteria bacterium]|nr:hypothetical protein [Pseudomonadota bacterium]
MEPICWWKSLENWEILGSITQGFLTAAAILAGGFWAYMLFIRQRIAFPRLDLSIQNHPMKIRNGWIFHTVVEMRNVGAVIARIPSAELRLRTVIPLPEEVHTLVDKGFDPVLKGETHLSWPMLAGHNWDWKKGPIEIEPGESDAIPTDFFVPDDIQVIQFYVHVSNVKKNVNGSDGPLL